MTTHNITILRPCPACDGEGTDEEGILGCHTCRDHTGRGTGKLGLPNETAARMAATTLRPVTVPGGDMFPTKRECRRKFAQSIFENLPLSAFPECVNCKGRGNQICSGPMEPEEREQCSVCDGRGHQFPAPGDVVRIPVVVQCEDGGVDFDFSERTVVSCELDEDGVTLELKP